MKKMMNKKGFTLMEMLIVVAIIAVLVAIAIPVFNGALTKSKEAADVANVRAAYAEWQSSILTDNAAIPTDKATFVTKITDGEDGLNYADKLTVENAAGKTTVTYAATKLTGDNGKTYTWTLGDSDSK